MHQVRAIPGRPRGVPARAALALVLPLVALLAGAAAGTDAPPAPAAPVMEKSFEGSWSATGTRQELAIGQERKAVIVSLSGSLVLQTTEGLSRGFRAEAIGFDNGRDVSVVQCVWTDDQGDQIYSELRGESVGAGKHFLGTITGGSGKYAGVTGSYELDWQYAMMTPEGTFQGRAVNVRGVVRAPVPPAPAPGTRGAP